MELAIFFFVAWLLCAFFVVMEKRLSITENTFVFLSALAISINFSWVIIEEFGWMQLTKSGMEYTAYLLNRSIITPMVFVIQLNLLQKVHSFIKSLSIVIMTVILLGGLSLLSSYLKITTYKSWNVGYDMIYILILNLVIYIIYKGYKKLVHHGVEKNDSL